MSAPTVTDGRPTWSILLLYVLVLGVSALPILLTTYPPLIDYPTHLGQVYVINHGDEDANIGYSDL